MADESKKEKIGELTTDDRERLIYDSYVESLSKAVSNSRSIVNIITDYPWSINYRNKTTSERIPAVYIEEFKQNASTFATSVNWMWDAAKGGLIDGLNSIFNKTASMGAPKMGQKEVEGIKNYNNLLDFNVALNPYKNMYSIEPTGLKFVFPFLNDYDQWNISNGYGDEPSSQSSANSSVNEIFKFGTNQISNLMGFKQLIDVFSNDHTSIANGIFVERPKYYQMPTSQDSIDVSFTLYNTISVNQIYITPWEKNYNLIKSFAIKNLPYKTTAFRYISPTLYKVTIPGIKYFPISYISSFSVTPVGVKTLASHSTNGIKIIVPEAWNIKIKFTSLLLPSSNLALAATESNITIS